jgi:nitroreductase
MDGESTLQWLRSRRSVRAFSDRPIERGVLRRVVEAATTAPSSTNRQPWRFAVVTSGELCRKVVAAVRERTEAMKAIIKKSHHAEEFGAYGDFFFEPLETAAAIIVPQYREYPDAIAYLLQSGGSDPGAFHTPASMQVELCGTCAAVMALLLQAHGEGLGACWMAGPTVAKDEIHALLGIRGPYQMVGAIALGHPASPPPGPPARRPLDKVAVFFEDEPGAGAGNEGASALPSTDGRDGGDLPG